MTVISFKHIILEVHCLFEVDTQESLIPSYCKYGVKKPGFHCMRNNCPHVGFAPAPHEIAYSGENGEIAHDAWIGFGGDMEPENYSESKIIELKELWKEISKENVHGAYNEYMLRSKLSEE